MPTFLEAASSFRSRFRPAPQQRQPVAGIDLAESESVKGTSATSAVLKTAPRGGAALSNSRNGDGSSGEVEVSSDQGLELRADALSMKDNNVQVVIRIRPLNNSEISVQGPTKCVRRDNDQSITWTGHPESRFTFDLVADEQVTQESVFKVAGLPMVENCMEGYNSCMFAYGQTGSGKTHTMLGDIEGGSRRHSVNCGMTPRVFEYLFSRIQKEKEVRVDDKLKFTCKISFLEIYNEQILDLLDPSSVNLQIREDVKKGVYVDNLKEVEVSSARDVLQQLVQGAANRKVAATSMNRASSRSHSVFTCTIESKWESQGIIHHRFARLHLVDLAGSERQKTSGAEGERLKEASNINKSLSTLGLVIMNLVSISNGKNLHVPYRDSKLTFLLQDSLGGNSKTIIIANISPSMCSSLETLSTLKFAQRAKFIRNNAIVNEDASGDVLAMRMQIQELKKELNRLRGFVSGESGNQERFNMDSSINVSPGVFKWDGFHGALSPLTSGRRVSLSQKREMEISLVSALKRVQEKERELEAVAAENQAAVQLAKERGEEIQSLRMRLRFREAGIKRLEAVAAGKLSSETHLLQENGELLREVEVLRSQVDRNQEVTRFAMENLRLNEEIRQLKAFYEDGERERMNEQITILQDKLLEALDWKLMHEKELDSRQGGNLGTPNRSDNNLLLLNEHPSSPWFTKMDEETEFLRIQAIQNEKEIKALKIKLESCMEEKMQQAEQVKELNLQLEGKKLHGKEGTNERAHASASGMATDARSCASQDQTELQVMVDAIAAASQREAEAHETAIVLSKENEELRSKLKVLLQDNSKLIELYEGAVAEVSRKVEEECTKPSIGSADVSDRNLISEDGNLAVQNVEHMERELRELREENDRLMGLYEKAMQDRDERKKVEHLEHQLQELHDENEKLMGLYDKAMQDRDEGKKVEHLEHQLQELHDENEKLMGLYEKAMQDRDGRKKVEHLEHQLQELHDENEKLMGLYDKAMQDRDEHKKVEHLEHQLQELHDENEKLMGLYEKAMQDRDGRKKVEHLEHQLQELHDENEKLMGLYEKAMQDRDEHEKVEHLEHELQELHEENEKLTGLYEKAMQDRDEQKKVENLESQVHELHEEKENLMDLYENAMRERVELIKVENLEHELQKLHAENEKLTGLYQEAMQDRDECKQAEQLEYQLRGLHEENEKLMGLYEVAMQEGEEIKRRLFKATMELAEKAALDEEMNIGRLEEHIADLNLSETFGLNEKPCYISASMCPEKHLCLARETLETAEKKIQEVSKAVGFSRLINEACIIVDKISREIEVQEDGLQAKHQEVAVLKDEFSETGERKAAMDNKLAALSVGLTNLYSSAEYWLQREARARARFDAAHQYVTKMKEELACLQVQRDEAEKNSRAARLKETDLKNQYKSLKIKLLDAENKRKSEKVLFAIDDLEDTEPPLYRNWQPGKASELLRSEEERTKLPAELKQLKEKLGLVHKDIEDSSRVCKELDGKMQNVVLEITEGTRKTMEVEAALNDVIHEKETLLEMVRVGRSEIEKLIVGYHEKVFESDLKEAEIFLCEEEACAMVRRIKEMKDTRMKEAFKRNELVEKNRWFDQHRVEQELEDAHSHVLQAKSILVS